MRSISITALALAAGLVGPGIAHAQSAPLCIDRDALVTELGSRYAERRAAVALTSVGQMVEVFASTDGTWTLVLTAPGGPSCIAAAGENWQLVPNKSEKPTI